MGNVPGIHHVTAIASDPQRNADFYTQVLGLRLVKVTVNFDDPGTYHFYFGDDVGMPGTILTFFPWPMAKRGVHGTASVAATALAVPTGSMGYWIDRLKARGVTTHEPAERFGQGAVPFEDHDAMALEIIESDDVRPGSAGWNGSDVPTKHAVLGFHSVTLSVRDGKPTGDLLTRVLGYREVGAEPAGASGGKAQRPAPRRTRYRVPMGGLASVVDVLEVPGGDFHKLGAGIVHHVAFRARTPNEQVALRDETIRQGLNVTPVVDRSYFTSIYFREPGGVLFEIATDQPGFTTDEAPAQLGTELRLPPQYEHARARIEANLPKLRQLGGM